MRRHAPTGEAGTRALGVVLSGLIVGGLQALVSDPERRLCGAALPIRGELGEARLGVVEECPARPQVLYARSVALKAHLEGKILALQVANDPFQRLKALFESRVLRGGGLLPGSHGGRIAH